MWVLLSVVHWCRAGLRPAVPGQAVLQGQLWGGDDDDDDGGSVRKHFPKAGLHLGERGSCAGEEGPGVIFPMKSQPSSQGLAPLLQCGSSSAPAALHTGFLQPMSPLSPLVPAASWQHPCSSLGLMHPNVLHKFNSHVSTSTFLHLTRPISRTCQHTNFVIRNIN